MEENYTRVEKMIKKSIEENNIDNNSYYIGYIHGIEDSGGDATELRKLVQNVRHLEHMGMGGA